MNLHDLQEDFFRKLTGAPGQVYGVSKDQFAVYQEQYWLRLFSLMTHDYPGVGAFLGGEGFRNLVREFFIEAPLNYDLRKLGVGFSDFLQSKDLDERALDLSYVEEAMNYALDAPRGDKRVFSADEFLDLLKKDSLRLAPHVSVIKVKWDVSEWLVERKGELDRCEGIVLVYRDFKEIVRRRKLPLSMHRVLMALIKGSSVLAAIEQSLQDGVNESEIQELFLLLSERSLIERFKM